jgi:hypothetical protein
MLLGGFPAVTLNTLTLAAAYVLFRLVQLNPRAPRHWLRGGLVAGGGVVLGFGLSAFQILPFVNNLDELHLEQRSGLTGTHLPLGYVVTSVAPDIAGLCVGGVRHGAVIPIESVGFVGVAAVLVALIALLAPSSTRSRLPAGFLAVSGAVLVTVIWVGGPLLAALQVLHFYSTNHIGRAQSVFGFVMASLAGLGYQRLSDWTTGSAARPRLGGLSRRTWLVRGVVALGVVVFGVVALEQAHDEAVSRDYVEVYVSALQRAGVLFVLAAACLAVLVWARGRLRSLALAGIAGLMVAHSAWFAHTMLPLNDRSHLYPVTSTHGFLQDATGGERYAGESGIATSVSDAYRLRTPVGHGFTQPEWRDLLEAVDENVMLSRTYSAFRPNLATETIGGSPILDQLAVRHWVSEPGRVIGDPGRLEAAGRVRLAPGEVGTCQVRAGALRGVRVSLARPMLRLRPKGARLHVAVHTPGGVLQGERHLADQVRAGPVDVAVMGEHLSPGGAPYRVEVWVTGRRRATVLSGEGTEPACAAVRPAADGLRLAHVAPGGNVYQRENALPRIRWASQSEVVRSAAERVRRLEAGIPASTVLLDEPGPVGSGDPGQVEVRRDEPGDIRVETNSTGNGYLVVADALVRDGWVAEVDGDEADLVRGNHAFGAVAVPAGHHTVVLRYVVPGLRTGAFVSVASLVVAVLLVLVPRLRRRRGSGSVTTES